MADFQYNKISLIGINKDLAVRRNALPVLQSKEAALRAETRKLRAVVRELEEKIEARVASLQVLMRLFSEFPRLIKLDKVVFKRKKVASIGVLLIDEIKFRQVPFSLFAYPSWTLQGLEIVKDIIRLKVELINMEVVQESIEYARRKTTQKVNLYEKVQIPFFEDAIRRIKRFLEDEENLSKSSQKVLKKRMEVAVGS